MCPHPDAAFKLTLMHLPPPWGLSVVSLAVLPAARLADPAEKDSPDASPSYHRVPSAVLGCDPPAPAFADDPADPLVPPVPPASEPPAFEAPARPEPPALPVLETAPP